MNQWGTPYNYHSATGGGGRGGQTGPDQSDVFANIGRIFTTLGNKLEKDVRDHLRNVYGTLALSMAVAVVGGVMNRLLALDAFYFMFSLASIGLMLAIFFTEASRANEQKRLLYLFGLAFSMGCTTGPLVEMIGADDPSLVFNAYIITCIVFGSFTLAALHAESTKFLHLGGILTSALLCLLVATFFRTSYGFILWFGLAIECGFVLYDTQLIAEKRRHGDTDYIMHTVFLFVDFVNLFRYIMLIMKDNKSNGEGNKKRR